MKFTVKQVKSLIAFMKKANKLNNTSPEHMQSLVIDENGCAFTNGHVALVLGDLPDQYTRGVSVFDLERLVAGLSPSEEIDVFGGSCIAGYPDLVGVIGPDSRPPLGAEKSQLSSEYLGMLCRLAKAFGTDIIMRPSSDLRPWIVSSHEHLSTSSWWAALMPIRFK